ncbi:MAG: hypothetical protein ACXVPK_12510, partial [Tumebacillaceae bacterium]
MSGRTKLRSFFKILKRNNFTILFIISGVLFPAVIIYALIDFVNTARSKDVQVQVSALKSELSQFALALRDSESASIAVHPDIFASSKRQLVAVPLIKPFFTYFLNRSTAKVFESRSVRWAPPDACTIDFSIQKDRSDPSTNLPVQVCFAYVERDTVGKYLYLGLKYPVAEIVRHQPGAAFSVSDHITLDLRSKRRSSHLQLVFEPPTLAVERYPSQLHRFSGLHEITAYIGDDLRRPTRLVSGQAIEQHVANVGRGSYLSLLIRIDSGLVLDPDNVDMNTGAPLSVVEAAIKVFAKVPSNKKADLQFEIPYGAKGSAVLSLEQFYATHVLSKAQLTLTGSGPRSDVVLWKSDDGWDDQRSISGLQTASDRWARLILKRWYKTDEVEVSQDISGEPALRGTLKQDSTLLPDVASRAFLYL